MQRQEGGERSVGHIWVVECHLLSSNERANERANKRTNEPTKSTYAFCEEAWTEISLSTKISDTRVPVSTIISLKAVCAYMHGNVVTRRDCMSQDTTHTACTRKTILRHLMLVPCHCSPHQQIRTYNLEPQIVNIHPQWVEN